ncbi:MAG TPA: hypothetical protein VNV43_00205 [Candidatus Acidoferrales bacterium]|nr:hypothetical protein [Candidatus Acidoferrales bacterium]
MKPFFYNGELLGEDRRLFHQPRCYLAASHSASSQSTSQKTLTTSGATSPISGGAGSAASSGSIALGQAGKYLESGASDLSGSDLGTTVTAGNGATITIGDQGGSSILGQLASQFSAATPGTNGGGAGTVVVPSTSAVSQIPWTALGLIGAAIAAIFVLGNIFKK